MNKDQNKDKGPAFVMDTCLAALQLTTGYRFLSTSESPPPPITALPPNTGDVPVTTGDL